jgi:PilZ domain
MTDEPNSQDLRPDEPQAALRTRTFLKGVVYYDNRRASVECTIRDLSDTGARIAFSTLVTVPDNFELHIPQKQMTLSALVRRRDQYEIGVSFEDQRSGEPRRAIDGNMAERVTKIENELVAMKRLLKKLEAKVLPNDNET